jgi:hypothetical protein
MSAGAWVEAEELIAFDRPAVEAVRIQPHSRHAELVSASIAQQAKPWLVDRWILKQVQDDGGIVVAPAGGISRVVPIWFFQCWKSCYKWFAP